MRRTAKIFQIVVGSAVFMGLGWQLPGNAAGVFLALWLCIVLRIEMRRAAPIIAIAAIGLALARPLMLIGAGPDLTNLWSPLIWMGASGARGFTLGVFLGLGFVLKRLGLPKFYALVFGFLLPCAGAHFALHLLRSVGEMESSLDTPLFRPLVDQDLRLGLLLGTITLLLGLWAFGLQRIPVRFALHGAAGGAAGFTLCLLLQGVSEKAGFLGAYDGVEVLRPWIVGASLGGAFGRCAFRFREGLSETMEATAPEPWRGLDYKVLGLSTAVLVFIVYLFGDLTVPPGVFEDAVHSGGFLDRGQAFALLNCALSCCLLLWSARSSGVAWQLAITLPVLASVNGLLARISMGLQADSFGFMIGLPLLLLLLVAGRVYLWHARGNQPLTAMALGLLWICAGFALLTMPVDAILFERETDAAVFRAVLLGASTIYGTVALQIQWRLSGAPPAPTVAP